MPFVSRSTAVNVAPEKPVRTPMLNRVFVGSVGVTRNAVNPALMLRESLDALMTSSVRPEVPSAPASL